MSSGRRREVKSDPPARSPTACSSVGSVVGRHRLGRGGFGLGFEFVLFFFLLGLDLLRLSDLRPKK